MPLHRALTGSAAAVGLTVGILLGLPLAALAAGVAYLPDVTVAETVGDETSLALLTWQLPGGVLIADRTSPGRDHRYGPAFAPAHVAAEWFVVWSRPGPRPPVDPERLLRGYGTIHLADGDVFVLEVPRERLDAFAACPLDRQRILLDPPPAGWDRPRTRAKAPAAPASLDPALVQPFLDRIDADAFYLVLQEMTGATSIWHEGSQHTIATRYYSTADKNLIGAYLADKLADYGYAVELDTFYYNSVTCRNVVATKTGLVAPDEYVVVGGHYDAMSQRPLTAAPGAEDNASGSSLVMELARISAGRNFDKSIQFVLFDSEEQGLNGSAHFVAEAIAAGRNIIGAITADMICFYGIHYGVIIEGEPPWEWLMSLMEMNCAAYTGLTYRKDYVSFGSDHVSFQQAGIAAFLAIDWDWSTYLHYHTTADTWWSIAATASIGVEILTAAAASLADVAVLQPTPVAVSELPAAAPALRAYPNPFNPRVTIRFHLDAGGDGELAVYDLLGRRVAVLLAGPLTAGEHTTSWNGRGPDGVPLASGVYLCRLRTLRAVSTLKLNLTR